MAAQATHDLAIKAGEYTDKSSGEVKARWLKIGTVFRHDDGGTSIKIDSIPVGLPEWNGWVSVFKREERPHAGGNGQHASAPRPNGNGRNGHGHHAPAAAPADFDDDIPF